MKALFQKVCLLGLCLTLIACSSPELKLSNGQTVRVSDYEGSWTLINYWAVWCKPCIEEIPELNRVNDADGFAVLGYNFDQETGERLREQSEKLGIAFPLLQENPAALFEQGQPGGLPATLVLDPQGKFHSWLMGPQTFEGIRKQLEAG